MLILLPPGEGKTAPDAGPPLALDQLTLPSLTAPRRKVLTDLVRLCRRDPQEAAKILGLSARQSHEVTANAGLMSAATAPAASVYSGVLFAALDHSGVEPPARAWMDERVLVWSGLWGVLRLDDPIPAYRLSGAATLPGLGRIATFWRPHLTRALPALTADHLVLDLRSGTYSSSWAGPPDRTVAVRVIHERDGRRAPASHLNKATKGRLVRSLAGAGASPGTPDELVDAVRAAGFCAEPSARGSRRGLDVIVDTL